MEMATISGTTPDQLYQDVTHSHPSSFPTLTDILYNHTQSELHTTIVNNTRNLIISLPPHSPFRQPLLQYFTMGMETHIASSTYNVSDTLIRHCRYVKNILTLTKYTPNTHRHKVSIEEIKIIQQIIINLCPTKSGSKEPRYYQYGTHYNLYQEYIQELAIYNMNSEHFYHPRSYKFFRSIRDKMSITHIRTFTGQFDCMVRFICTYMIYTHICHYTFHTFDLYI